MFHAKLCVLNTRYVIRTKISQGLGLQVLYADLDLYRPLQWKNHTGVKKP